MIYDKDEEDESPEYTQREFIDLSARLTLHEFLLEIVFAADFVQHVDPHGDFASMRSQMLDLLRFKITVRDEAGPLRDGPPDLSLAVQDKTVDLAERFFDNTALRLSSMLKQLTSRNN